MTITGTLEHIDGRKLLVGDKTVYLRKGIDSAQFLPLLASEVVIEAVEEKGFLMTDNVKPVLPKAEVEKTKPVDMPPSKNLPKPADVLYSAKASEPTGIPRSQKDIDILTQWSYGQATQAVWANCNDSLALNTDQMKGRIRALAKWYRDEVLNRAG